MSPPNDVDLRGIDTGRGMELRLTAPRADLQLHLKHGLLGCLSRARSVRTSACLPCESTARPSTRSGAPSASPRRPPRFTRLHQSPQETPASPASDKDCCRQRPRVLLHYDFFATFFVISPAYSRAHPSHSTVHEASEILCVNAGNHPLRRRSGHLARRIKG
jgi:hypothetical protein